MDAAGSEVKDVLEAVSEEEAQSTIRQMGYFVTKISIKKDRKVSGSATGFAGPMQMEQRTAKLIIDHAVAAMGAGVSGANKTDYHMRNVVPGRHCGEADRRHLEHGERLGCPGEVFLLLDERAKHAAQPDSVGTFRQAAQIGDLLFAALHESR